MAGKTKAELLEEVRHLSHRVTRLEQELRETQPVTKSRNPDVDLENSDETIWLKQIYRDAPVGLCYFDTQLRYININEWLAALNGRSVNEHLGRTLGELYPELATNIESQLLHVIETGEPVLEGSICIETPAQPSVPRHFQYNFVAVKSDDDRVVGLSCAVLETTQQRRAEELLRKSQNEMELRVEQRTLELQAANTQLTAEVKDRKAAEKMLHLDQQKLQLSLNATGTCCWEINLKTGGLTALRPTSTWMGYEPDEVPTTRESWKSLIHPDDVEIPKKNFQDHLAGRSSIYECEYRVQGKSGEWYWTLDRGLIVEHDTDGTPLLIVGTDTDITEQKRATEALRSNQQFLKKITDSVTQLVWVYNLNEQRYVYANPALAKFYGRSLQEICTAPESFFRDQIHPDDLEIYDSHAQKIYEASDEEILERELRAKNHAGEYHWYSARDIILDRDVDGSPLQILGTALDITDLKRAELLLTGEKKFLEVVSSSNSHDDGLTELVEFIETQSDGMTCSILLMGDDGLHLHYGAAINLSDEYSRAIDGLPIGPSEGSCGTAAYLNQMVIVSDIASDPLWVNFRNLGLQHGIRACWSIPIRSSTGHVLGTFAMYYNEPRSPDAYHLMLAERAVHLAAIAIERKNAEEALRESEQRLRLVADSMPAFISYIGADRSYRFVNKRYESTFDLDREQIIGKPVWEILGDEYYELIKPHLDAVLAGNPVKYESVVALNRLGNRTLSTEHVPDKEPDGTVRGFFTLAIDITERKVAEEQIWKYKDELAHMARISTMGEMATGIAHELNQPLTAIASYSFAVNVMTRQVNSDPHEIQDILSSLENQAIRAGEIVRRLRQFTKKTESVRVPADLNNLVQDVIKLVEPDIRQAVINLALKLYERSPTVLVDEIQIQQVLVNLIRNSIDAMQAMPASKRDMTISTQIMQNGHAQVIVSDSGIGIAEGGFEQIFNTFFSTKQTGMGMGLPISRSIIEAHGGKLFAKPNDGPGVTFGFSLPQEESGGH